MKTRMIQIRHVPEDVHRRLHEQARRAGMSLSDYLRREVTVLSQQLSWEELFDELDQNDPAPTGIDWTEEIREGRKERDNELMGRIMGDDPEP